MHNKKETVSHDKRNESPEERKERYRKNKQESLKKDRENRKKEIEENRVPDRRLSFLQNVFKTLGYTQAKIAELTGTTQQALSWYFSVKDDCRLSQAERFLDVIGYTLKVNIRNPQKQPKIETKTPNEGQNKGVKFHIQGDFAEMASWNGRPKPAYLENCQREARMFWLAQYIQSLNEPITEMMRRCGIDLTCLRYIFVKDDIKISQIFKIASGTDGQIYWNITKKKEE